MSPRAMLQARSAPLGLVIFDCDGVIVDSEPVANRVVSEDLTRQGWPMTPAEADGYFLGMTFTDMISVIEARLGRALSDGWKQGLIDRLVDALSREATPIPGAVEALHAVSALGLPWRIASNSSHEEMRVKFACIGISELVMGRVHSHRDVARGKPAPDLFLATAARQGVAPANCIVIEDSTTGGRAAAAAGMDCLGLDRHGSGNHLRAVGAVPFNSMFDLPALIGLAHRKTA